MTDTLISHQVAAQLLHCGTTTVERLIHKGVLTKHRPRGHGPSLSHDQVIQVARQRLREQQARAERIAAERSRVETIGPPDEDQDWLGVTEVAKLVGVSRVAIQRRIVRGTLPATWHAQRWWIRRGHLVLRLRAEQAQRTRQITPLRSAREASTSSG